ncbi:Peptidase family A1 domain [Arabidopsis thaliana x Arabidopsis arenosa]|uniref:Peptidase family A1 domain n=1 Tax=Arabidopsis thaliana x Arabidopsis arenosa TaxID=1240361 RepID=A0A8T2A8F7_9BRAS|nr:Peptidase family A1 domain [Arabidopsis thaliana x Arabidopsis arenosa]
MSLGTTTMIVLFLQIITCFLFTATTSSPHGFTIDLIQRRSNSSSSRLSKNQLLGSSPYADTVFDYSIYLMRLQLGTPPFEIAAEIDTGSDLIWTQCMPCPNCYNQFAPIFDPSKSSTFKEKICHGKPCHYEIIYADESYSTGTLATETVTIQSTSGEPFVMAETSIGCGLNNSNLMTPGFAASSSGIVGLNMGPSSLISQMDLPLPGLMSYCFSSQGTSKINFGTNAVVAGDGTVAADMFIKKDQPFYYLNLDAVSVGDKRIETLGTPFHAQDGNIFIDSGTTYTYLPTSYCNLVREAVAASVVAANQVPDPSGENLLCYNWATMEIFPVITLHFAGGADLVLDKYNMYVETLTGGTFCLAIGCGDPSMPSIFGNRAQNNLLVGYDSSTNVISFSPTNCSALWS